MARLPIAIAVTVFLALAVNINGENKHRNKKDTIVIGPAQDVYAWICMNSANPQSLPFCNTTTTTAPPTPYAELMASSSVNSNDYAGNADDSSESSDNDSPGTPGTIGTPGTPSTTTTTSTTSSSSGSSTSSLSPSDLQRAHWCSFNNGSYIPLDYTFMYSACELCQCTQSRQILCAKLPCMATYCIDSSAPVNISGQCCSTCQYDPAPTACVISGINFPHGTILKSTSNNVQCWCEFGNVECRQMAVVSTSSSIWDSTTQTYLIIIIVCVIVIFGSLLCCGFITFYYFYKRSRQQATQEAYEQYYNNVGWQPMAEDGTVIDENALQKQAEAEQGQVGQEFPTGHSEEYIPPPYALYNGTYPTENKQKDPKYV